jgi:hypothetical protein
VNRGTLSTGCGGNRLLGVYAAVVVNEGIVTSCDNSSGTVRQQADGASLVNTASGRIEPGSDATLFLDVPVVNEGTITIGAGRTVVVADSVLGGVWGGEGTLDVDGGGELVAASDATVTLAGALTRLSGSLSGSGSFVVSAGSVLESWDGDVRAGLVNRGTLSTGCGGNRLLGVYAAVVVNEGIVTSCDNSSGTVRQQADGASLVNTASGRIEPGSDATLFLDVPVVNEGTITIGAGSVRFDSGLEMQPSSQVKVSVGPSFAGGMPVSGGAVVGGELTVITEAGFEPAVGATRAVGSWQGGVSGWWSTVSGAIPGIARSWVPSVSAGQFSLTAERVATPVADFDGDGLADRSVFRPEFGGWFASGQPTAFLGLFGDVPVPGDYDGDGVTERGVFRDGAWFIDGQATRFLGTGTDVPVPGDYDGDGTWEAAVYREGAWFIEGQPTRFLGAAGDVPVPGDYDGDGTTEIAVFRPSVGGWYVDGVAPVFYGLSTDVPVPGDYDGDGSTDSAVYRPEFGGWYVDGQVTQFIGLSVDVPVPADYNGDGITERAVFRPEFGGWYVQDAATVFYGLGTDIPLPLPAAVYNRYYGTNSPEPL